MNWKYVVVDTYDWGTVAVDIWECVLVYVMLILLQMSKGRGFGGGAIEQGRTTRSCK